MTIYNKEYLTMPSSVKTTFGLLFLLLFSANLYQLSAQTLTGNVKDLKSNTSIYNSKVEIKNLDNGIIDSVFSDQSGNWTYNLITTVNGADLTIPNSLYVDQNFPNPFNPSTRIQFSIPVDGLVEVSVHNILGELIDFKSQFLTAGNYSINWISTGSAGVYFYTIKTNNQSFTKKMIQLDGGSGTGLDEFKSGIINYSGTARKIQNVPVEIVVYKLGYVPDEISTTIIGNEFFESALVTVHSNALMIDLHNDVMELMIDNPSYNFSIWNTYNHTDIPRLRAGEVDMQFFAIWIDPDYLAIAYQRTLAIFDVFNTTMNQNQASIQQAFTMEDALSFNEQGKIAAIIGVEGGHSIEESLEKLENLYNLGMRYMTITWNNSTSWAVAAADTRTLTVGLNDFGRDVIRKMDSLGIIIDISHVGIKTIQDILEVTTNPIVATHSGARALVERTRNLYDWQIQDIANSGGVIGIVFYPYFLTGTSTADIDDVIRHIDHIVNLEDVSVDNVAIGSDFDGIEVTPSGLENVSKFPDLTMALLEHGYSQLEVEKILGGNFRRVFEQVENNSKVLKKTNAALK